VNSAFYALAVVYSIRIFFESVEKYGETLVVLACASAIMVVGRHVFGMSLRREVGRPSTARGLGCE
jgi:hypothetical protein